jgi:hypothetical protein
MKMSIHAYNLMHSYKILIEFTYVQSWHSYSESNFIHKFPQIVCMNLTFVKWYICVLQDFVEFVEV